MDVNEELKFLRKFTKKIGGGGGCLVGGGGSHGGCEVIVKIQKKSFFFLGGGGSGWGSGVDVNEELKFLRKFTKKFGIGSGGERSGGGRVGGGSGWM